jgi:hypothetical protein
MGLIPPTRMPFLASYICILGTSSMISKDRKIAGDPVLLTTK